jgi:hypothetical protein
MLFQTRVMPELLLNAVTYALMIVLARQVWASSQGEPEREWILPAAAGAIVAFGVVTKLTFVPVAASTLVFFTSRKRIGAFFAGAIAGGVLVLLPVIPRIPEFVRYFWKFFSHAGYYGRGEAGLLSGSEVAGNLKQVALDEPLLVLVLLGYSTALIYFAWNRRKSSEADRHMLHIAVLSGWISIVLQIALMVWHYKAHYLLPAILYVGFVNAVMVAHQGGLRAAVKSPLMILCAGLALVGVGRTTTQAAEWAKGQRNDRVYLSALSKALEGMPECIPLTYDYSAAPIRALHYGNASVGFQQGWILQDLYPDSLVYSWQDGKAVSFLGEDETDRLIGMVADGRCVVLVGAVIPSLSGKFALPPGMDVRMIAGAGSQGIYRLVPQKATDLTTNGVSAPQAKNLALGKPTTQSLGFSEAAKAVDGKTDGLYFRDSVTHTIEMQNPWWEVDLGASRQIDRIVVWNRTDCCMERLKGFWVFISEEPFDPSDKPGNLRPRPGTWNSLQSEIPDPTLEVAVGGVRGRYIRIQLDGKNALSVAEVEVYGNDAN